VDVAWWNKKIVAAAVGLALAGTWAGSDANLATVQQPPSKESHPSVLEGAYTNVQAERGKEVFAKECLNCHQPTEFSNETFAAGWRDRPVGAFYGIVRGTMPVGRVGELPEQQYVDVVAYVLQLNGYPAGPKELPANRLVLNRLKFLAPAAVGEGAK
jgi:mono/diheme cytochrome c family protein